MKIQFIPAGQATDTIHRHARDAQHDRKRNSQADARFWTFADAEAQQNPADDSRDSSPDHRNCWSGILGFELDRGDSDQRGQE